MKNAIKKNGILLSAAILTLSLMACSNYVQEFEDDYHDLAYTDPIVLPPESSSSGGIISSSDASNFIASSDDSGVIAGSSAATLPVVVLANCDNFEGEVWYSEDKKDGNLFEKTDSINFQYYFKRSDVKYPVQLYASNAFCIEYESFAAYENIEFYIGNEYKNSLRDTLDRNSPARAFNLDVALDNCVHWKDSSEATACTESNLGNAANNVNYFVSRNARITKVKAIGFTIAESSSNSSSSNELKNCDAYNSGKALYMDNAISSSLFKKFTKNDSTWFVMNGDSVVQLNSSSMFCIEYSSTSDDSKYFYYGSNGKDSSAYFKKYLNADSALAFSLSSVNVSGCIRVNKGKTYYDCNSYTGRYALDNMNFFGGANGLSIKKVYLLNADVIPDPSKNVSSSSSAKSSSSADNPKSSSSSSSVASSSSEVCSVYSGRTNAPVAWITFVNENGDSKTSRDLNNNPFKSDDNIISNVKQRVVNSFSACELSDKYIQVKSSDNGEFNDNDTFESICDTSKTVKVIVSDEDFSCIDNYSKCFSENKLSFNSECPVAVAAKFLGSSSSSISGTLLFEANKEYKMTNDSAINVVGFDSSFADGWMKVVGYLSKSPYIFFFTDPSDFKMPVDISAWGGICMTYASNVDIKVVARKNWEGDLPEDSIGILKATAASGNLVKSACVDWKNGGDMTKIDQIQLVPVSSSSSDPAVIYIKNISTKKKTDVKIDVDIVKSCQGDGWVSCDVSKDEQINLSLFESYTVDGLRCSQFDLGVSAGESKYYTNGSVCTSLDFTENITNIGLCNKTPQGNVADDNLANVENPILTDVSIASPEGSDFSITFHPKSWYAAPVSSSTSN